MTRHTRQLVCGLIVVALAARFGGIFITEVIGVNPFGAGQVHGHTARAEEFAAEFRRLEFDINWTATTAAERWAPILALFWLLPGPSGLYAQVGMALLGTAGVYNVFVIARHYHSEQAGLIAALPLALFPTYVFMHSVIQREATILFLLTTAFILVFLPPRYIRTPINYGLGIGCVLLAGHLRVETLSVYLAIIGLVSVAAIFMSERLSRATKLRVGTTTGVFGVGAVYVVMTRFLVSIGEIVDFFANLRARRARGRATYLPEAIPSSLLELIAFSWIGAIYFLFTPFPWHLESVLDIGGLVELIIGITYALFAILGALVLKERTLLGTLALISLIILFSVLFGFGTANYGTAVRHRQTVFWAIFILGAIGISSKVQFKT